MGAAARRQGSASADVLVARVEARVARVERRISTSPSVLQWVRRAAVGHAAFLLLGWTSVLVPALVVPLESTFRVSDADIGALYFVMAAAFLVGTVVGGGVGDRVASSSLLTAAGLALAAGLAGQALAPGWLAFTLAAIVRSTAVGIVEVAVNALFLRVFTEARGKALNLVHFSWSAGALLGPLAVAVLLAAGVGWQPIMLGSAGGGLVLAAIAVATRGSVSAAAAAQAVAERAATDRADASNRDGGEDDSAKSERSLWPFAALAVAIGCYVASEAGVAGWMVRFLADFAPLPVATTALALFWGGLTVGRLISAQIADRFDHIAFAFVSALAAAAALAAAVVAPLPVDVLLFALGGLCLGPIYPMIMVIGGALYPHRLSTLSGGLTGAAVVGSLVYPPLVGLLPGPNGIALGLLGAAALGIATGGALLVARALTPRPRGAIQ